MTGERALLLAASLACVACLVVAASILGMQVAPWLGWALGAVVSGTLAARLIGRQLDAASIRAERVRTPIEFPHRPTAPVDPVTNSAPPLPPQFRPPAR